MVMNKQRECKSRQREYKCCKCCEFWREGNVCDKELTIIDGVTTCRQLSRCVDTDDCLDIEDIDDGC